MPLNEKMRANIFKPGQSGNPKGGHAAIGSRNRLQGAFLHALADDFEKHGKGAIDWCRRNDPIAYVKVCASLMPKEFKQVSPLEEMTEAELVAAIDHLRTKINGDLGTGTVEAQGTQSIN